VIAASVGDGTGTAGHNDGSDLVDLAQRVLEPVRILLEYFGAPLLTVATSRSHIQVAPWAPDLVVQAEINDALAARYGLARALREARLHGSAVCALLARRWPANGTPPIIGVVTDGVGMAVSGGPSLRAHGGLADRSCCRSCQGRYYLAVRQGGGNADRACRERCRAALAAFPL